MTIDTGSGNLIMNENTESRASGEIKSGEKKSDKSPEINGRLPCRGCTRGCGDYGRCEGKPWRIVE